MSNPGGGKNNSNISARLESIPYRYDLFAFVSLLAVFINSQLFSATQYSSIKMIGILLLPMACSIWIMALVQMKRHGGIPASRQYYDTTVLIDQGLFSVVRHPQYLSYILLTAGFILISQHISVVIPGVIAILCFYMQTLQEEKLLRKKFTDDYEKYCRRVHRFNLVAGTVRYFKNHP